MWPGPGGQGASQGRWTGDKVQGGAGQSREEGRWAGGRPSPAAHRHRPFWHLPSHSLNFFTSLGSPSSVKSPAWMSTSP